MLQIKCVQAVPCYKSQQMQMQTQAAVYLFVGKQVVLESCCSVCGNKG
jgi:hypothetical protein